jgi:hypothetical protein
VTIKERVTAWAREMKRDVKALALAARDPRVPCIPSSLMNEFRQRVEA